MSARQRVEELERELKLHKINDKGLCPLCYEAGYAHAEEEAAGRELAENAAESDAVAQTLHAERRRAEVAEARLDRELIHKTLDHQSGALCGQAPGYMSSIRLTRDDAEVVCKGCFDVMLAAERDKVATYAEAVGDIYLLWQQQPSYAGVGDKFRALLATPPDGVVSARQEVERLRAAIVEWLAADKAYEAQEPNSGVRIVHAHRQLEALAQPQEANHGQ